jgi:hypothetical protein
MLILKCNENRKIARTGRKSFGIKCKIHDITQHKGRTKEYLIEKYIIEFLFVLLIPILN